MRSDMAEAASHIDPVNILSNPIESDHILSISIEYAETFSSRWDLKPRWLQIIGTSLSAYRVLSKS